MRSIMPECGALHCTACIKEEREHCCWCGEALNAIVHEGTA